MTIIKMFIEGVVCALINTGNDGQQYVC
jgi:hypothetical protein